MRNAGTVKKTKSMDKPQGIQRIQQTKIVNNVFCLIHIGKNTCKQENFTKLIVKKYFVPGHSFMAADNFHDQVKKFP